MGKSLVIVESPAKAKTINKYLGKEFIVKSSVGHIRDLPTSGSNNASKTKKVTKEKRNERDKLVSTMGINPYDHWKANYEILPGKHNVVNELISLAEDVEHIYLATDLDREGEAIAWHLQEIIGGDPSRYRRVVFNEITKNAIQQAFQQPSTLNIERVNAQQARRFMDRVVGYMVSPLLWKKVARGLSAGRVQSVAVRLIVEREHEIKAFVPEEYWEIKSDCITQDKQPITLQVMQYKGESFRPTTQVLAQQALHKLQTASYEVSKLENKPVTQHAPAPFITSTLQQAASNRLGFGVKKTMLLAQRLYEAGYITYMRTDSTNLSQDALEMARGYIKEQYGSVYLPETAITYLSKGNAQEAHEAIRPSDVAMLPQQISGLENDAQRLYEIIWKQFLACQMVPAKYDASIITVKADDFSLKARGKVLRFDGWTKVQASVARKSDDNFALPNVTLGERLTLDKLLPSQHFTKPSPRFNEASLVKELEKRGIGRPSTYAAIISTIQDRGYVRTENRRFYAEKMGEIVTNRLISSFNELMDYDFTARMEGRLDDIAEKKANWISVLDSFFENFNTALLKAQAIPEEGGMDLNPVVLTSLACPTCDRQMGIRTATTGVFLGCSGYALPKKEQCKQTINLIPEYEVLNILEDESETNALLSRHRCRLCGTAMDSYLIDHNKKIHICGNNPECTGYEIEEGSFKIKGYEGPIVECEKCGSEMHLKAGRFGKYMGCTNPECKNTRKILKNGEVAPPREDPIPLPELKCTKSEAYFVLRDGAAGIFLAANNFPKSRETRTPLVAELIEFKTRLPEKFLYLTSAPAVDPEGNPTIVRFSRKTKQQYISSEKNGKTTGWSLFYLDGQWQEKK